MISIEWEYFLSVLAIMVDFHALRYIMFSISLHSMSPASLPIILHHFVVVENQMVPGHLGGGALAVEGGKMLWSVGGCTILGFDGRYAPQSDDQICGKILLSLTAVLNYALPLKLLQRECATHIRCQ